MCGLIIGEDTSELSVTLVQNRPATTRLPQFLTRTRVYAAGDLLRVDPGTALPAMLSLSAYPVPRHEPATTGGVASLPTTPRLPQAVNYIYGIRKLHLESILYQMKDIS